MDVNGSCALEDQFWGINSFRRGCCCKLYFLVQASSDDSQVACKQLLCRILPQRLINPHLVSYFL